MLKRAITLSILLFSLSSVQTYKAGPGEKNLKKGLKESTQKKKKMDKDSKTTQKKKNVQTQKTTNPETQDEYSDNISFGISDLAGFIVPAAIFGFIFALTYYS